jgi:hypothetical protein
MTPENLQQQLLQRYLDTKDAHHKSLDKHAGFLEKVLKPIMIPEKPPLAMDGPGTGGFSGRGTDFQMPPAPGQGLPDLGNPPSAAMPPGMDDLVNRDPSTFNGPQSIPPMPLHDPSKPNMLDDLVQRGTPPQPQINDLVNRIPPDQNQIISQAILKMMQGQGR